ncbi:MFS transporter [Bifidobacterium margollesii]|uniref:MFS transporter n=1 Tax=Bifidobacterium margollesii TaxID=2020964 RepID=A0A2N5JB53_9BIFI|nr:MFS transporter [Bifidobacterium margollesii]PLS31432.1 MFS transporter [Bifidobacterium margollesii]
MADTNHESPALSAATTANETHRLPERRRTMIFINIMLSCIAATTMATALTTAFLITRFPTKRLYLIGAALFILGSVVCVLSSSFPIIMIGRVLQAGGNALLTALRTIAGAIGQAVFVGLMGVLSAPEAATMQGLNLTFLAMGVSVVPLVLIPLVFLRVKRG